MQLVKRVRLKHCLYVTSKCTAETCAQRMEESRRSEMLDMVTVTKPEQSFFPPWKP